MYVMFILGIIVHIAVLIYLLIDGIRYARLYRIPIAFIVYYLIIEIGFSNDTVESFMTGIGLFVTGWIVFIAPFFIYEGVKALINKQKK